MPGILVEGLFVDVSEHELVAGIVVVPYPLIAFLILGRVFILESEVGLHGNFCLAIITTELVCFRCVGC